MNVIQLASFYTLEPSVQLVFKHSLNGNQHNRILRNGSFKAACQHVFGDQNVALPDQIRQGSDQSTEDDPFNHVVENRSPTSRRGSPSRSAWSASREGHLRGKRDEDHVEEKGGLTSRRGIRSDERSRPASLRVHHTGKHDDEPFLSPTDYRKHAYVSSM
jgi:hypothetical protein